MADRPRLTPRRALAELTPSPRTAHEILTEQNAERIQCLVPLRMDRMLTDQFAFLRGSAAVMAADLASGPSSGVEVLSCGDAHLANFGVHAAPDRSLLFDLDDFDEVASAPAEWDLKRLATSVVVAGRHLGHRERSVESAVTRTLTTYQSALRRGVTRSPVERYYDRFEPEHLATGSRSAQRLIVQVTRKARTRTTARAFATMVAPDADGRLRIKESPTQQRLAPADRAVAAGLVQTYATSVPIDVANLVAQYELADVALRVVGVGSVGSRCYVAVLLGPRRSPLILQIKQASASVLVTHGRRVQPRVLTEWVAARGEGARVVGGQRVMQTGPDAFLGSFRHQESDYYVRQFRDMKGSVDIEHLSPGNLAAYAAGCAVVLAAAHSRSRQAVRFADYLGKGASAPDAIRRWSYTYADKLSDDYAAVATSYRSGPGTD